MEMIENCVENGKSEVNGDVMEQQYVAQKDNLLMGHDDEMDNKSFDFEANFNGNGEENDDGDGNYENR
jgi:hypothetical protein